MVTKKTKGKTEKSKTSKPKQDSKKSNEGDKKIILALGALVILFTLYNIIQVSQFQGTFEQKLDEIKEANRPAVLQLTVITDQQCSDCFDITSTVESIKSGNVNITEETNIDFRDATELINEYQITSIPTVIVEGEIERTNIRNTVESNDALLFNGQVPPYTNPMTGEILGRVGVTIVEDLTCEQCFDMNQIVNSLIQSGITIVESNTVDRNSEEGKILIEKYSIESLPQAIVSEDLRDYGSEVVTSWSSFGTDEQDAFVTRLNSPPYVSLTENRVVGLLKLTKIVKSDCASCYSPETFHKPIIARLGAVIGEEVSLDETTPEGQALIEKYSITKLPTIIIEGDVETYPALVAAWRGVGSVEEDGAYIFRQVEVAQQLYYDLTLGEVVEP